MAETRKAQVSGGCRPGSRKRPSGFHRDAAWEEPREATGAGRGVDGLTIHQAKDYGRLVAQCQGFLSEAQLLAHFELYQGYVKRLNEIEALLTTASRQDANYSHDAYSELRRREPVAYNGTFLHELYFGNLGPAKAEVSAAFRQAEEKACGSWDNAMADLKAMTQSTHGWVLVTCELGSGRPRGNPPRSPHDGGLFANQAV